MDKDDGILNEGERSTVVKTYQNGKYCYHSNKKRWWGNGNKVRLLNVGTSLISVAGSRRKTYTGDDNCGKVPLQAWGTMEN